MEVLVIAFVSCEPLMDCAPDQSPDALQLVASPEFHVKVDVAPLTTTVGLALMLTVGCRVAADTLTVVDARALLPDREHEME